jgi:hypothetical protein
VAANESKLLEKTNDLLNFSVDDEKRETRESLHSTSSVEEVSKLLNPKACFQKSAHSKAQPENLSQLAV